MTRTYFVPTALYKGYKVLECLKQHENITQREIALIASISVSMVNKYLTEYEDQGFLHRLPITRKNVSYTLTERGIEYLRFLNIRYFSETQMLYNQAKEEMYKFLNNIIHKNYRNIVFYGAGKVAEIMLNTINSDKDILLNVVGIIDDDEEKQGKELMGVKIFDIRELATLDHDAVMITSYINNDKIVQKLSKVHYPLLKVEQFFK